MARFNPIGNKPWSKTEHRRAHNQDLIAKAIAEQPGTGPLTCREAHQHSRRDYVPCGAKATRFILSERGRRVYPMCEFCADHNVRSRDCEDLGEAKRHMRHANYTIKTQDREQVTLEDIGPWDQHPTITNDAEWVVERVARSLDGRRLFYIDSEGNKYELIVRSGRFFGFRSVLE